MEIANKEYERAIDEGDTGLGVKERQGYILGGNDKVTWRLRDSIGPQSEGTRAAVGHAMSRGRTDRARVRQGGRGICGRLDEAGWLWLARARERPW